ncbi:MAG TPA: RelA/SpoT domain-containing protein, partial [Bacteroidia bacterium]|nr:RelA/SpoT domain-containing protein [Bacteroidia bacterium]
SKAFAVDRKAVVARRLKRTPSIISKLQRESGMKLDRMEDIGGVRIIVDSLEKVYRVHNQITGGRTRNILRRERDYITYPKPSGYRGIHLIYRYNGAKVAEFPFHNVELQIRTKIQHAWATTVEVVGTFTNQGLKASRGSTEWLEFFTLAGEVFATMENGKLSSNDYTKRDKLIEQSEQLSVLSKLQAYAVTTQFINERANKDAKFYIMTLNAVSGSITVSRFTNLASATKVYGKKEIELRDSTDEDVVLVSTESLRTLKLAYPNYFADTTHFRQNLRQLMANKALHPTAGDDPV